MQEQKGLWVYLWKKWPLSSVEKCSTLFLKGHIGATLYYIEIEKLRSRQQFVYVFFTAKIKTWRQA